MRIIHTADWHLGRIFYGVHLTQDQAYVLDQFIRLVREAKPEVVVIAGDVYDRAVPPPEAVSLLDETLSRLVIELKTRVVLIAGNHDSPERLGFGTRLLAQSGLHVAGRLGLDPVWASPTDANGPVNICAIPYAEPALARERFGNPELFDHASAMRAAIAKARTSRPRGARSVLVAHALVVGGEESESERPLSVGGTGAVEPSVFDGFSFVALGHLHRPQRAAGNDRIYYSGSLLQYSFSEAAHSKSVNLVELDAAGRARVERIPLAPRRAVRCVTGTLEDLLRAPVGNEADDYLSVTLLDRGPVFDPVGRLRAKYPNVLELKRAELLARGNGAARVDYRTLSDREIFASFFQSVRGEPASEEEVNAYLDVVERVRAMERESPT
ncbi:MAG TPA: exonuclease SbcCD subunit D [Candidatus Methylomirabilis sp.]|nr:exonuclease SbcCD subunit D [Candidatus Methylomirabilis sp.]